MKAIKFGNSEHTHGVGGDGDRLVAVDGRREVVHQVRQSRTDGRVVLRTDNDEPDAAKVVSETLFKRNRSSKL